MSSEIRIRTVKPEDAAELLEIYRPYVVNTAISFEYEVPSLEEFTARIERTLQTYPYLAAVLDGTIIGYAYASAFHAREAYDWAVETSVYVKEDARREGCGKRLYLALEEVLKKQNILNLNACIAYTRKPDEHLTNDSMRFHEHLGYRLVGTFYQCGYKFHHWYDMIWMEKLIGEHRENQPNVIPFPEIEMQEKSFYEAMD